MEENKLGQAAVPVDGERATTIDVQWNAITKCVEDLYKLFVKHADDNQFKLAEIEIVEALFRRNLDKIIWENMWGHHEQADSDEKPPARPAFYG